MTRFFCIILFVCSFNATQAQILNSQRISRLAAFGKVWGFLKYYHPEVAKGKYNWDGVLVSNYHTYKELNNKEDFNRKIIELLDSIGFVEPNQSKALAYPDSLKKNLNISWIYDTSVFNLYTSKRLQFIYENKQPGHNFYVSRRPVVGNPDFKNEEVYNDIVLPSESYRILGLFRYWNIINYFFPYFYQMDKNWDTVLLDNIPRFVNVKTDYEYFRKVQELCTHINDGHGMVYSSRFNYFANLKILPVKVTTLEDKTYIVGFLNDTICQNAKIQKGDIIEKVDHFETKSIRNHLAQYLPSSNKTFLEFKIDQWFPMVKKDTVNLEIRRKDSVFTTNILTVTSLKKIKIQPDKKYTFTNWKLLSDSVGYINMGLLKKNDIKPAYKVLQKTKYLIIDSRNYPHWVIYPLTAKLLKTRKIFMKLTEPDFDYPGLIKWVPPLKTGKIYNPTYYTGKIIILTNSETMSRAEFTIMALKQAENVIIIGSQTAGADGDVSIIPFPGAIYSYYSGLGVYQPNGQITQRVGIIPDIPVQPTLKGLLEDQDEYIDRAMYYINTGK